MQYGMLAGQSGSEKEYIFMTSLVAKRVTGIYTCLSAVKETLNILLILEHA